MRDLSDDPVVAARGPALGYGRRAVVTGVDFEVGAGERLAILGPNGGGKTTLIRAITGELAPMAGELTVARRVGLVAQTERSRLDYPVSALDVALMGTIPNLPWWRLPGRADRERALDALRAVGLGDRARATFGDLSGGQRQRVLLARALVQEAEILMLDEPYRGLDLESTAILDALVDDLADRGVAVLVATHDLGRAQRWDRVLVVDGRQEAFGAPDAVLAAR